MTVATRKLCITAGDTPKQQLIKIEGVDVADSTCSQSLVSEDGLTTLLDAVTVTATGVNADDGLTYHHAFIPLATAANITVGNWIWSIQVQDTTAVVRHERVIKVIATAEYVT